MCVFSNIKLTLDFCSGNGNKIADNAVVYLYCESLIYSESENTASLTFWIHDKIFNLVCH